MKFDAVLIAGPTASGKSQVALAVAEAIGASIVNADAMQIYREVRVLTARPSDEATLRVPHHLYGHVGVAEAYSVGRYRNDAARALDEVQGTGRVPLFTGGTGLYFSALTEGLAEIPSVPTSVREAARAKFESLGPLAFHAELAVRDPEMAVALRPSDRQRVLRAFEIVEATGRPIGFWQKAAARPVLEGLRVARFVLDVSRETLRERIAVRFRAMVAEGALEEAALIAGIDPALPAAKILGARELQAARQGQTSVEDAMALSITRTRQYAKRQATWARHRMADWHRIEATDRDKIVAEILRILA
jgi:tRNA dimethylallyltransferase